MSFKKKNMFGSLEKIKENCNNLKIWIFNRHVINIIKILKNLTNTFITF